MYAIIVQVESVNTVDEKFLISDTNNTIMRCTIFYKIKFQRIITTFNFLSSLSRLMHYTHIYVFLRFGLGLQLSVLPGRCE